MTLLSWDEFPAHSSSTPIGAPATTDPRFNDGYYFGVFTKEVYIFFGLRMYPNTNVCDGYAGIRWQGNQHNLRISRPLWPDRDVLAVGPLRVEIVEPFREMRITLSENDLGLKFDLVLFADLPAIEEALHEQFRGHAILNRVKRYTQVGRARGRASFNGRSIAMDDAAFCRDHSWGIRASMGSPMRIQRDESLDADGDRRATRLWLPFELPSLWGFVQAHWDVDGTQLDLEGMVAEGSGRTSGMRMPGQSLQSCNVDFAYDDVSGDFVRGSIFLSTRAIDAEIALESTGVAVNPQGFGYRKGWLDGMQPGVPRGQLFMETDVYSFATCGYPGFPEHLPDRDRMGPVEYIVSIACGEEEGIAQMEHPRYAR